MAKKITGLVRLQLPAGQAVNGPPVSRGLGRLSVNVPVFCREFNAATAHALGTPIAVIVTVYEDQSFSFAITRPASRTPAEAMETASTMAVDVPRQARERIRRSHGSSNARVATPAR